MDKGLVVPVFKVKNTHQNSFSPFHTPAPAAPPFSYFVARIQSSQSTTNTLTLQELHTASTRTHKGSTTGFCTVMPFFESVMPEALHESLSSDREHREKLRDNGSSCIRNMDGTLTLLVQRICVSIPLAAVQTSPGFTVH